MTDAFGVSTTSSNSSSSSSSSSSQGDGTGPVDLGIGVWNIHKFGGGPIKILDFLRAAHAKHYRLGADFDQVILDHEALRGNLDDIKGWFDELIPSLWIEGARLPSLPGGPGKDKHLPSRLINLKSTYEKALAALERADWEGLLVRAPEMENQYNDALRAFEQAWGDALDATQDGLTEKQIRARFIARQDELSRRTEDLRVATRRLNNLLSALNERLDRALTFQDAASDLAAALGEAPGEIENLSRIQGRLNKLEKQPDPQDFVAEQKAADAAFKETNALKGMLHKALVVERIATQFENDPELGVLLLNEVNAGVENLKDELDKHGLELIAGPRIHSANGNYVEYYPIVIRKEKDGQKPKIKHIKSANLDDDIAFNKAQGIYRPIVVYDLEVDGKPVRVGIVHTSPYGSEFERKKVYDQLKERLAELAAESRQTGVPLVIGGDFYLSPEAKVVAWGDVAANANREIRRHLIEDILWDKGSLSAWESLLLQSEIIEPYLAFLDGESADFEMDELFEWLGKMKNPRGLSDEKLRRALYDALLNPNMNVTNLLPEPTLAESRWLLLEEQLWDWNTFTDDDLADLQEEVIAPYSDATGGDGGADFDQELWIQDLGSRWRDKMKKSRGRSEEELTDMLRAAFLEDGPRSREAIKALLPKKKAQPLDLVRNLRNLEVSAEKRFAGLGLQIHQPITGTNWKTSRVDRWFYGQIADYFLVEQEGLESSWVGLPNRHGVVHPADDEDLSISNYWQAVSDHFLVTGHFRLRVRPPQPNQTPSTAQQQHQPSRSDSGGDRNKKRKRNDEDSRDDQEEEIVGDDGEEGEEQRSSSDNVVMQEEQSSHSTDHEVKTTNTRTPRASKKLSGQSSDRRKRPKKATPPPARKQPSRKAKRGGKGN